MKVMTVLGTRPEIIRLSRVMAKLDGSCAHVMVHTGQNFDPNLKDVFFEQLGVRAPDVLLDAKGTFGEQVGTILSGCERAMREHRPDRLLILGDTNSGLAAIIAKRMKVRVYHMEAGNRCYDDRVPEEVNRRIIDHSSDVNLPYTERSRMNLLREGIAGPTVFVTGNPILEVINHYDSGIRKSDILDRLGLKAGKFVLVTTHRAENVDVESRLRGLVESFERLHREYGVPVIVSTHPRTRSKMEAFGVRSTLESIRFLDPFSFFDFVTLERQATVVLSDSGTVQEECTIFQVPHVIVRDVTERPETVENGCSILSGCDPDTILRCVRRAVDVGGRGVVPREYLMENVSDTVVNLILGM